MRVMNQSQRVLAIRGDLTRLRVRELQNVLMDLNLARSGRKQELIERVAAAVQEFQAKAIANASNQAVATYYSDQIKAALRSIDTQLAEMQRRNMTNYNQVPNGTHHGPTNGPIRYQNMPSQYGQPIPYPGAMGTNPPRNNPPSSIPPLRRHPPSTNTNIPPLPRLPPHLQASGRSSINPDGVEVLHATNPDALEGARCFCGASTTISGRVVTCAQCGCRVHAKCHQLVTTNNSEWYCENCRSEIFDPFLRVVKTVLPAQFVRFATPASLFRMEYRISDQDLNDLYAKRDPKQGGMSPGCRELQLRCFTVKDGLASGASWPTAVQVTVNGFNVPVTQRSPPGTSNPSKVLRELPSNLFPFSRVGRNNAEIRASETSVTYAFMVQIVEYRDINDLVAEVQEASKNTTFEMAKAEVIKSFGDEDEDDFVVECTVLSVRCPLGLCVIQLPARGAHCTHLQCFDLKTFLQFNKKARSKAYDCTICHNFIKMSELRIDPYLKRLLTDVEGDDELEEVEIDRDGSWSKHATEESAPEPPPKRVKQEIVEGQPSSTVSNGETTSTESTSSASAVGSNAGAAVAIDLCFSSDDEDEDENASSAPAATSSTQRTEDNLALSQTSQTSTLSDDEVAILTVDSDIWEIPAVPTSASLNGMEAANGASEMLPLPLDDPFFNYANNVRPTGDASASASWNGSNTANAEAPNPYSRSIDWTSNGAAMPLAPAASNQSEVDLANAMALLSRNHPNVSNPFQQQQVARARNPPQAAPTRSPDMLDVIDLLDSDSD